MTRRSQRDNDLVDSHVDISAVERSLRRAQQTAPTEPIRPEMEAGQGSGEANTDHSNPDGTPDITAEGVDDLEEPAPRHRDPQPERRTNRRREFEVDDEDERIGAYDEPGIRTINSGIPTPRVPNSSFKAINGLINSVKNSCFNGLPSENPLDHLDLFERFCAMCNVNGISEDAMKMLAFPFSLEGLGRKWERSTPSHLLSTWDDVKKEFLTAFFPKNKTEKFRADISGFRQGRNEGFPQAWNRFRGYLQNCPHHGFGKGVLLGMFYRGCRQVDRNLMDSSSGGSFSDNSIREGERLIATMAKNGVCEDEDYDRDRIPRYDTSGIHEVREKMERIHIPRSHPKEVHFCDDEFGQEDFEQGMEVNFMENNRGFQNQGYQNRPYNNNFSNNQGWRNNNNNNSGNYQPQRPQYNNNQGQRPYQNGPQWNQQSQPNNNGGNYQKPAFQNSNQGNFHNKTPYAGSSSSGTNNRQDPMDEIRGTLSNLGKQMEELTGRVDGIATHVKVIDNQVAAMASSSKTQNKGKLPGKPEENPKEFCQHFGSDSDSDDNTEEVINKESDQAPRAYFPKLPFPGAVRDNYMRKDTYDKANAAVKMIEQSTEKDYLLANDAEFRTHYAKLLACKKWCETKPNDYMGWLPGPELAFPYDHFADKLVSSGKPTAVRLREVMSVKPKEQDVVEMYEPRGPIEPRVKKREDPGCFTSPCMINGFPFERCVLDLGASKSIMPLHIFREAVSGKLEKTNTILTLADWSTIRPAGVARDVPVVLQGHILPTDFLVVDIKGRSDKIIFGRPFLSSAGAEFKVREGLVEFKLDPYCRKVQVWRDPDPDPIRPPFSPVKANFLRDLASTASKRLDRPGVYDLSMEAPRFGSFTRGFDPGLDETPDFRRLELLDEAGPSTGQTRDPKLIFIGASTRAGKTSMDSEGENKPPDREHDSGDNSTVHPGHSHTS